MIKDLPADQECVIVGTLFKEMKYKPNILDEYDKGKAAAARVRTDFLSPDDALILEDETGRIRLVNPPDRIVLDVRRFVTGPVIALRGVVLESGVLQVHDFGYLNMPAQPPRPKASPHAPPRYACLVSGLRVGDPAADTLARHLLVDWITGFVGATEESAAIAQVVIAGQSLAPLDTADANAADKNKTNRSALQAHITTPLAELDVLLSQLAAAVPVVLLPGGSDPANLTLPQQPLHSCLFRSASSFSTLTRTTNPAAFTVDGVAFLGSSGQNIDDMAKFAVADERIDFLENTLRWGHVAPTAPDTLQSYPFHEQEPFVVYSAPHVYVFVIVFIDE
jgi:DNA polymerase delta subunit 2